MWRPARGGLIVAFGLLAVAATACGGGGTPLDPETAARVDVFAPIDEAEVVTTPGPPAVYSIRIVSGLPNSCAEYKATRVHTVGNQINVDVNNSIPADPRVTCGGVYGAVENVVELPDLEPSSAYTITVNDDLNLTLTTLAPVEKDVRAVKAPLRDARLELTSRSPLAYTLVIDSGLENTCMTRGDVDQSRSGGRGFGDSIRVNLTNLEMTSPTGPCETEFVPYQERVDLPGTFTLGGKYQLILNHVQEYEIVGGSDDLKRVK